METSDLIGRFLFMERGNTFLEIKAINPPDHHGEGIGETMTVRDWRTDETNDAHFPSEIGTEYQLVPENYPPEKIAAYCNAANAKDEAEAVMMDVEFEIGLGQPDMKQLEKAVKQANREEGAFPPDSIQ